MKAIDDGKNKVKQRRVATRATAEEWPEARFYGAHILHDWVIDDD